MRTWEDVLRDREAKKKRQIPIYEDKDFKFGQELKEEKKETKRRAKRRGRPRKND